MMFANKLIRRSKIVKFPGGELHVNIDNSHFVYTPDSLLLECGLFSSDDIMGLLLTVDAIKRHPVHKDKKIHLLIKYLPYARQDRVCNPGESLSVKVMCDLLNTLGCDEVTIYDPHSDVAPALLNNCKVVPQCVLVSNMWHNMIDCKITRIISPDAGAEKKSALVAKVLQLPLSCASKVRDLQTGNIISTRFDEDITGENVLICDDICDGGRTFIELAKKLKEKGANKVYLYVTHGIFSRGLDVLKPYIDKIFCYNVFPDVETDDSYLIIK